jgi:hypothetical protein
MTLEEFHALCRKEWDEERGDIVTLWLTQESYAELQQYAMENPVLHKEDGKTQAASRAIYNQVNMTPTQVGISLSTVVNPITKNPVKMKLARDKDAADIYSSKSGMHTRILETA